MAKTRSTQQSKKPRLPSPLMVRLDDQSKSFLAEAAQLRRISVSDYVRMVIVAQARKEVLASKEQIIALTADEQVAFWKALNEVPKLTEAQRRLGAIMRGAS